MVNVGIIGLGLAWEARYRPAVEKLRNRIRIRSIYDSVASRARLAAGSIEAEACTGMLTLAERRDIHALLLLDTSWHGTHALRLLSRLRKPLYIADWQNAEYNALLDLHQISLAEGTTFMPEMGRRYTPATSRLRELIATRIGRPRRIHVEATLCGEFAAAPAAPRQVSSILAGWFDWSRYIAGTSPMAVQGSRVSTIEQAQAIHTEIRATVQHHAYPDGTPGPVAEFCFRFAHNTSEDSPERTEEHALQLVTGESGEAQITGPCDISWTCQDDSRSENLHFERNETELMLGLFCRRAIGGLIPVADLKDACRGIRLEHSLIESLTTGARISLNGEV